MTFQPEIPPDQAPRPLSVSSPSRHQTQLFCIAQGWRVNYESVGQRLAREIDAVPALWSRAPEDGVEIINPRWVRNRTHEDPEGTRSTLGRPNPFQRPRPGGDGGSVE